MSHILEIQNLSKNYGSVKAVENLSLSVQKGQIFGLLGPNGSGKTTTLGTVLGVTAQDTGTFNWFGQSPSKQLRQKIGAILESPNFYPYLSAHDNLKIAARIKKVGSQEIERVLKTVGLYERQHSNFKTFSLGMKQRLAVGSALLGDPEVLVLDEPTNGLDPQGIAEMRQLIINLGKSGKTIIIASHLLDEIEKVCSHVAVLKNGKLLASGPVHDILGSTEQYEVASENLEMLRVLLNDYPLIKNIKPLIQIFLIEVDDAFRPADLNKFLFERGIVLSHLQQKKHSLEAQFLELTS